MLSLHSLIGALGVLRFFGMFLGLLNLFFYAIFLDG